MPAFQYGGATDMPIMTENQQFVRIGGREGPVRIENPPRTRLHTVLFHLLLWHHFRSDDDAADSHAVDIAVLTPHLDIKGRPETQLALACEQLARTVVKWELTGENGLAQIGFSSLLSQAWCENGVLCYSFPSRLKALLRNEKGFRLIRLDLFSLFKGRHTRPLYDLLSPLADVETRGWWDLAAFRRLSGLPGEVVDRPFSELRRQVIEPALEEINAVSDLSVQVEYRRRGNRVTAVKFRVTRKNDSLFDQCLYLPGADPEKMDPAHHLEQEFEAYKAARVCEITSTMTERQVESLQEAFESSIQGNRVLTRKFEQDGFDNLSIRLRYESFLEKMLLSEEETDFESFRARRQGSERKGGVIGK
jgi:hypothetical protein